MTERPAYLGTSDASRRLGISPMMLRRWEGYFGFPMSAGADTRRRQFLRLEVEALHQALAEEPSVPRAMAVARGALGDTMRDALRDAYTAHDEAQADRVLEACLASRSLEVAVSDVIVGALRLIERSGTGASPTWAFASAHAMHVLSGFIARSPSTALGATVLVADATGDALDNDAVYVRALELLLRRHPGWRVETCSILERPLVRDASTGRAHALLIAGSAGPDAEVARWTEHTHRQLRPTTTAFYRRMPPAGRRTAGDRVLPGHPASARRRLVDLIG